MSQKVIANFVSNAEDIAPNKKLTVQETNPKNLGQAVHNVLLGMELLSVLDAKLAMAFWFITNSLKLIA